AVRDNNVPGRHEPAPAALLAAIGLKRGDPILFFDAEEARRRIERIAWVERASVQRILPDTILINIVERSPHARWQIDGRVLLVDREGKVLSSADPARFGELRRVVGPGAERRARALFEMLEREPELAARVRDAVRVRDRRWDLEFDNGITVQLPEHNAEAAWAQLALMQRERQVLERAVSAIDLRLPGRVVVRLTPEAMEYLNPPKAGRRPGGSS
ncbi:MAG: cell division protein FtsQ/DivIB, partial [Alphaproteobacteria bacterium]|nr:cell division protein FtsQ/DivIB [Alphaproteobacteria bacterium]